MAVQIVPVFLGHGVPYIACRYHLFLQTLAGRLAIWPLSDPYLVTSSTNPFYHLIATVPMNSARLVENLPYSEAVDL